MVVGPAGKRDQRPVAFPAFVAVDSFPLPTAPGLGVIFDEDAVADHPFELWDAPHWRRRDGSFTNW